MNTVPKKVVLYTTQNGKSPYQEWFQGLKDTKSKAKIAKRIDRICDGNMGDYKALKGGVFELRIDYGPGYRVYLAQEGETIVILLLGGDKSTQDQDIEKAKEYYHDFKRCNPL